MNEAVGVDGAATAVAVAVAGAGRSLRLFEAVGVELEYMIVDAETLDVRPEADRLFAPGRRAP